MKAGWTWIALVLAGCGDGGGGGAAVDAGVEVAAWERGLAPAADAFGVRRGMTPARGIIHLHSPYSHDACDGDPRDNAGVLDAACVADLRAALCDTRMDFAALTEHDDSMADEAFGDLFLTDELVPAADAPVAGRIDCDSGHSVLWMTGGENDLMPIMIDRHPEGTVEQRHAFYNANGPDAVQAFRDHGALVYVNHAEGRDRADMLALAPDGLEIYQLHANIDPDIREDDLGLDGIGAIEAVLEFADTSEDAAEPDLAILSFLSPNEPALAHWHALIGAGHRVAGSAGTDAHQNALPIVLRDGERGDSYRRMLRWFSNVALVTAPADPAAIEQAVASGRYFAAFEVFGTPHGFDATLAGAELGGDAGATGEPLVLSLSLPTVHGLDPRLPAPEIRARVLRIDVDGTATEVAATSDAQSELSLDVTADTRAFRVEVLVVPRHLGPYLRSLGTALAEREYVWIYANPFYIDHGLP